MENAIDIFAPRFQNEDASREHLEALHWPEGPTCPHCGSDNAKRLPPQKGRKTKAHPEGTIRKGVIQCNDCRQQYTVTVGTVFERSKVPLNKWLLANHMLCASKKGISGHQMARMLGVTYKTAWFMMHRIREAMKDVDQSPIGGFGKFVEADETYIGGKHSNKKHKQRKVSGKNLSPFHGKQPVVSLVERGGKVRSFHVAKVTGETLRGALVANVDRYSYLMTDEHSGYRSVGKEFGKHSVVVHSRGEYVRGAIHTNTIEGFFSLLKRGIIGVYHHVSEAHLHRYTSEFDFRYNTRKLTDFERADESLLGAIGKRLIYRRTSESAA
ncbi:putative transposase for insertion sequence element [Aurantiacibacter atlanticus]|uniref:Putative transposase for insertion sequence element n=1 Tax=Aurantiacibacter atlanticus TaxID=1648404 RepID=A0A0H4VGY1_9SPHN|nr:IS1595 family transposase [Aurantiacibacter atlanticus]AKQ42309.1 putative transposase for insertion sequence element [Aurantiacibacter atlanticus]